MEDENANAIQNKETQLDAEKEAQLASRSGGAPSAQDKDTNSTGGEPEQGTMSSLASGVSSRCTNIGKNCLGVLTWIGRILWIIVPILLVVILVSILISSWSDTCSWTRALNIQEKTVHIDFMVLSMDDVKELESVVANCTVSSLSNTEIHGPDPAVRPTALQKWRLQKTSLLSGSYVLVDAPSKVWDTGVYVFAPETTNDVASSEWSATMIHVQDIDPECKYVIKRGVYRNQVYQPRFQTSNLRCDVRPSEKSSDVGTDKRSVFFKVSELGSLSGTPFKFPDIPSCVLEVTLEVDVEETMQPSTLLAGTANPFYLPGAFSSASRSQAAAEDGKEEKGKGQRDSQAEIEIDLTHLPSHRFSMYVVGSGKCKLRFSDGTHVTYVPEPSKAAVHLILYEGKVR